MSRVVFVLGAGASKECGAPVMGDFLDVAADLYHAGAVKDSREHFERVFDTIGKLQAVHSKAQLDLTNIESVFTAFELGQVIQRLPGLEAVEITQAIVSLKKVILETLQTTIKFPTRDRYIEAPTPYAKFAQLLNYLENEASPTVTVSVVTFNYDIALDLALCRANLGPDYIIEPAPNKYRQVSLMKLHGSLNWSSLVVDREIRPLHFFDYLQVFSAPGFDKHSECTIPIGSQLKSYFSERKKVEVNTEPVIVPPTWNKADYHQALSKVWTAAAKNLSEAEFILVIGYSLPETDAFFRLLYALGTVGGTTLRKFVVFNPDPTGSVDRRFRELLGPGALARYQHRPVTFSKAIEEIRQMFPAKR